MRDDRLSFNRMDSMEVPDPSYGILFENQSGQLLSSAQRPASGVGDYLRQSTDLSSGQIDWIVSAFERMHLKEKDRPGNWIVSPFTLQLGLNKSH
jgi:hypothetical protein